MKEFNFLIFNIKEFFNILKLIFIRLSILKYFDIKFIYSLF